VFARPSGNADAHRRKFDAVIVWKFVIASHPVAEFERSLISETGTRWTAEREGQGKEAWTPKGRPGCFKDWLAAFIRVWLEES
jgi:hypothetical protein